MVTLVFLGPASVSHTDPPLGQLEPGTRVFAEPEVAERLQQTGLFELDEKPDAGSDEASTEPADQPDSSAQED